MPNWLPTGLRAGSSPRPFGQLKGEFMQKASATDAMVSWMNTSIYLLGALLVVAGLPEVGVPLALPFLLYRIK